MLLVSSGAVGMGMRALGLKERPRSLGLRQACAAVGQGHLMHVYTGAFAQRGRDRGPGAADRRRIWATATGPCACARR